MKLRTKLILYTILPMMLAVSVIIYNNYRQSTDVIFSNIKNTLQSSSNFIAESVNFIFEDIKSNLYILSSTDTVKEAFDVLTYTHEEHSIRTTYLKDISSLFPFSKDMFIMNRNGEVIISTNPLDEGNNYSDREYFVQAINGVFCVSQVLISRVTNQETVYLANPVFIDNAIAGVIVVSIQIDRLMGSLFQKTHIIPQMQVVLIDQNNNVLSTINSKSLHEGIKSSAQNYIQGKEKQNKGFFLREVNGIEYTGYFQKIEYSNWMVLVAIDNSDLYALAKKSIVDNIAVVAVCLSIIFGVVAMTVAKLSSALFKGLHFARKVTEGDFDAHLDSYSNDEIGKLYDALRTMMQTIQNTKSHLQGFLEEKDSQLLLANENLSKESALMRIILDNMPDIIFYKNTKGVYEGCNLAFVKFVGKKNIDDVVGRKDADLFDEEFATKFAQDDASVFQSENHAKIIEEKVETPAGNSITFETVKTLYYTQDNKPLGLVGVSRDISLRKAAEIAIELASEKAIEASNAKTEFLARMSHEIRTPLNAIIGMTFLLQKICTDTKQLDFLYKIDISAKNLLAVVNDVLDFSKIEAGKIDIERVAFDLHDLIDEIVTINEAKALASNLDFHIHIDDAVHTQVFGDRLRIAQILINLISNAIKFTAQGCIKISIIQESSSDTHQTCIFSVEDTGIGMSEIQISRLFSPFTQGDGSITRRYGGSGLGLTISKMLLELMEGEIWLTSCLGIGTTFLFRLNLEINTSQIQTKSQLSLEDAYDSHRAIVPFPPKRILVVEDNPINQEIAQEILHLFGLHVDIAENGEEAIHMCALEDFDLILMDIQMPVMNGYVATKILRANPRYKDIPILAMTANAFNADRESCINAGMNEHVAKPFDPAQLKRSLQKWLNISLI